eukprot:3217569-Rhodomonas_salina.1
MAIAIVVPLDWYGARTSLLAWHVPTLLPSLPIQAPVSKFVVGGADLMLPGTTLPTAYAIAYAVAL